MIDQHVDSIVAKGWGFAIFPHSEIYKGYVASLTRVGEGISVCSECEEPRAVDWDGAGHGFTIAEAIKNEVDRWHGRPYRSYRPEELLK